MLIEYVKEALRSAEFKILDDETFFGEVPEIEGAWGNASTLEDCRDELAEAIEGWLLVSLHHRLPIPIISGIDLNPKMELLEIESYQLA